MASDGAPGAIAGAGALINTQTPDPTRFQPAGTVLPQRGQVAAAPAASISTGGGGSPQSVKNETATAASAAQATGDSSKVDSNAKSSAATGTSNTGTGATAKSAAASTSSTQSLVEQINKYLNDSGRADEFRVDPNSDKYIQQVNPATGAVIAEYSVSEFPALARSIGASGLLIDDVA